MNRNDFRELARVRLREAKALLDTGHASGAYYLAGYAVECALKACIARRTKAGDFPDLKTVQDSHTHSLERLVTVAGLRDELDGLLRGDERFELYWRTVKSWSPDSRYEQRSEAQARDIYQAITDRRKGILQWLRRSY